MPLSMQLLPRKFQLNRRGIFTNINKWRSRIVRSPTISIFVLFEKKRIFLFIWINSRVHDFSMERSDLIEKVASLA